MRLLLTILLAGALLAGCAAQPPLDAGAPPAASPGDGGGAVREVAMPEVRVGALPNLLGLMLAARIDRRSNAVQPSLRVRITYTAAAPRSYGSARDERARLLKTEPVQVGDARCAKGQICTHEETVRIELPDSELRQARVSGYRLKLFARNGPDIEIGIPGAQIAALYDKAEPAAAVAKEAPRR